MWIFVACIKDLDQLHQILYTFITYWMLWAHHYIWDSVPVYSICVRDIRIIPNRIERENRSYLVDQIQNTKCISLLWRGSSVELPYGGLIIRSWHRDASDWSGRCWIYGSIRGPWTFCMSGRIQSIRTHACYTVVVVDRRLISSVQDASCHSGRMQVIRIQSWTTNSPCIYDSSC